MTDRHTVDSINSDQLDQLYDNLDRAETENAELRDALAHCHEREPRLRAEAAVERVRELHRKATHGDDCVHCAGFGPAYDNTWPCQTIRALDEPAKD